MAKIRLEYWIPSLQHLVKKAIKKCCESKRFHVSHYPEPSTGLLPVERTTQNLPFIIICIDYAVSLIFKTNGAKKQKGVHIAIYMQPYQTYTLTKSVYTEVYHAGHLLFIKTTRKILLQPQSGSIK